MLKHSLTSKLIIPWQVKIIAKIFLSRLRLGYSIWKRFSLFEHGGMDNPAYALDSFRKHFDAVTGQAQFSDGFTCLELGPGDSLFSALIAHAHGAGKVYLVDVGDFAVRDVSAYNRMADFLAGQGMDIRPQGGFKSFDHVMDHCGAVYLTEGVLSLKDIPDATVDFVWSQAVLEHVRVHDFSGLMAQLLRIMRPQGISSHRVDLGDHLGGALDNLRFSNRIWESELFSKAGFYTNRIQYGRMVDLFKNAGFKVNVTNCIKWQVLPTPQEKMAKPFLDMSDEELRVHYFDAILRPNVT